MLLCGSRSFKSRCFVPEIDRPLPAPTNRSAMPPASELTMFCPTHTLFLGHKDKVDNYALLVPSDGFSPSLITPVLQFRQTSRTGDRKDMLPFVFLQLPTSGNKQ